MYIKYEVSIFNNSIKDISYSIINSRFSVVGGYMLRAINNRPVITKTSVVNQDNININSYNNTDIQVENM